MHDFQSWGNIFQVHHKGLCVFGVLCVLAQPSVGLEKISELDGHFHESITAKFHTELPGEVLTCSVGSCESTAMVLQPSRFPVISSGAKAKIESELLPLHLTTFSD